MKSLLRVILLGMVAVLSRANIAAPLRPQPVMPEVATLLPALVRQADRAVLTFYHKLPRSKVETRDRAWIEKLAVVLEKAAYLPEGHCFCIAYPEIELFAKDKRLVFLSVHHGFKLRCYADEFAGDFAVGEETGQAVRKLAMDKKVLLPPPTPEQPRLMLPKKIETPRLD